MLNLDSCWAKFARAKEHLDSLESDFRIWNKDKPLTIESQTSADQTHIRWIARQHAPIRAKEWALQLSDAFANLRCSLDHLVWAIALFENVLGKPNPPDPKRIAFPIVTDIHAFKLFEGARLRNFSQPVRAEIERMQPYNRGHPDLPPLLGLLGSVDNVNKHKLLMPVAYPLGSKDSFVQTLGDAPPGCTIVVHYDTEMKDGAVLANVTYPAPLKGQVAHHFRATFGVAIAIDGAPDPSIKFRNVSVLFAEIAAEVRHIIECVSAVV